MTTPDLTNPTVFQAELAKAKQEPEAPAEEEGDDEAIAILEDDGAPPSAEDEEIPAEEEGEDEAEDEGIVETDKGKMVPKSRLDAIAKRRDEEASKAQTTLERAIRAEKERDDIKAAVELMFKDEEEKAEVDAPPLDPETQSKTDKKIAALEKEVKESKDQALSDRAAAAFRSDLQIQQTEFVKTNPDLDQALGHLYAVEYEKAKSVLDDEGMADVAAKGIMTNLAAQHWRKGKNVPQEMYKLAQKSGYTAKKTSPGAPDLAAIEANGKKTRSVGSIPAAPASLTSSDFTQPENFEKLLGKHKSVDKTKFNDALAAIKSRRA